MSVMTGNFNEAVLVFAGAFVLDMPGWYVYGWKNYHSPVMNISDNRMPIMLVEHQGRRSRANVSTSILLQYLRCSYACEEPASC